MIVLRPIQGAFDQLICRVGDIQNDLNFSADLFQLEEGRRIERGLRQRVFEALVDNPTVGIELCPNSVGITCPVVLSLSGNKTLVTE